MTLPHNADVIVIGAGVIGASIAYHLTKENIQAVVLDKEDIASGSSGACEGLLLLQSKKPGIHLEMALESIQRFPILAQELDQPIEYENKGGLVVIETEEELEAMQVFVEKQKKHSVDVALLTTKQAREKEPALSENIIGATFSPLDGQVNPMLLTRAFLRAAQKAGTKVFSDTQVSGIELTRGRVGAVHTNKGRIETRVVINAAGTFAAEIGEMVNLTIPIKPRRGQILVTEATAPILKRCILSAKYIAAKFNPKIAEAGGVGFAVEQTANGNILIGSTREFVGFDKHTTYNGIHNIAKNILPVIPKVASLHVIRTFSGLRPYTPDGLPIFGKVESVEGFIMAAGHEGDGITLSPITGEMIARLVSQKTAPFPFNDFRLDRFSTKQNANSEVNIMR
jgi:glycine/D-amino acid oxidase-like deaminating enzyme